VTPSAALPAADSIVAIATPPGTGAIGVIGVSGPRAVTLVSRLVRLSAPGCVGK